MKRMMYLVVWTAIKMDCEWARIYERLVPIKCSYDEKTRRYTGRRKIIGRLAGQIISMAYMLLKKDQEVISRLPAGAKLPTPTLYDPEIYRKHREGQYPASLIERKPDTLFQLPPHKFLL